MSRAKNTATNSAPEIMSAIANTISHGGSPRKVKSPYPTVVTVSTVKYTESSSEMRWPGPAYR